MEKFTKGVLLLICGLIGGGSALAVWMAGAVSKEIILHAFIGVLVLSPFVFIGATVAKMPFVGFKKSLFAFGLIVLVAIF